MSELKNSKKLKAFQVLSSLLTPILYSVYPAIFLLFNNIGNVRFNETLPTILFSILLGTCVWLFFVLIFRSLLISALCSFVTCIVGFNFKYIMKLGTIITPRFRYWHAVPITFFVLICVFYLIATKINTEIKSSINSILNIVGIGLLLINFLGAIPQIIKAYNSDVQISQITTPSNVDVSLDNEDLSNIYWFIFDEYSNFDILEKYYDYDNKEFLDFLENNKFTVSLNGINESQQSATVLTNYVYLDYVADDSMNYNTRNEMGKNGIIWGLLESYGYTINAIEGASAFGLNRNSSVSQTINGETFSDLITNNSIIYPFVTGNTNSKAVQYNVSFAKYQDPELYNTSTPTLNFAYYSLPHQPFVYDENGGEVSMWHTGDWVNKEYYLNQLIYTTKLIMKSVTTILKNDPDSIIIIQSDHGARSLQTESGKYLIEKFDRRHFLNVVYYRGEPINEIVGKSGVNTLRIVLNKLLNTNFEELEVPESEYEF